MRALLRGSFVRRSLLVPSPPPFLTTRCEQYSTQSGQGWGPSLRLIAAVIFGAFAGHLFIKFKNERKPVENRETEVRRKELESAYVPMGSYRELSEFLELFKSSDSLDIDEVLLFKVRYSFLGLFQLLDSELGQKAISHLNAHLMMRQLPPMNRNAAKSFLLVLSGAAPGSDLDAQAALTEYTLNAQKQQLDKSPRTVLVPSGEHSFSLFISSS